MKHTIIFLLLTAIIFISCRSKSTPQQTGSIHPASSSVSMPESTSNANSTPPPASKTDIKSNPDPQHPNNPYYSRTDISPLNLQDSVWRRILPEDVYETARHAETERAFTGKYWDFTGKGTYYCAACGNALFRSDAKFASSCGWPSFFEPIRKKGVTYKSDNMFGIDRTEVNCGRCGAHLGHLFDDGPPPSYKRYCMNSVVLEFEPDK